MRISFRVSSLPRLSTPRFCSLPEPRRAAVALVIRVVPSPTVTLPLTLPTSPTLTEFFQLNWVNDPNARPEILFVQRDATVSDDGSLLSSKPRNTNDAHVAFPGGRMEPDDEGGLYTGMFFYYFPPFHLLISFQPCDKLGKKSVSTWQNVSSP